VIGPLAAASEPSLAVIGSPLTTPECTGVLPALVAAERLATRGQVDTQTTAQQLQMFLDGPAIHTQRSVFQIDPPTVPPID